ncbi:MAG: RNA methyltransferase [Acidobacteriota bacterium]
MSNETPPVPQGPAIILVEPQLGENIGAAARAMLNCGLTDLRLVSPRDGWPNPSARSAATAAVSVVDGARVFATTSEAVADLQEVYATTARRRDFKTRVCDLQTAGTEWRQLAAADQRFGVLFGPERTGLANDDLVVSQTTLTIPLNPECTSLNLAQAVLLISYEWYRDLGVLLEATASGEARWQEAKVEEVENLFEHLVSGLDRSGYLRVPEKRPVMMRNLRNLLSRARMTPDEVKTFHGVISALSGHRKDGRPVGQPGSKTKPRD